MAIASVVVLVAATIVALHFHIFTKSKTTPLSVDQVTRRFEESTSTTTSATTSPLATTVPTTVPASTAATTPATVAGSTTTTITTMTTPPARLPALGVYVYTTTGRDSVDALTGDHHNYPAQTTITVTAFGCGVKQRWDVAKERWEEWQRCADPGAATGAATVHE
ncbi:MAG TPA: hypothetical protein VGM78_00675, partial [Ilumatobacteraceae bacterium]